MNKTKFITAAFLLMGLVVNSTASADSPSFTYVGAEYVAAGDLQVGNGRISADLGLDGFALTGSAELGIFFLQASRYELDGDKFLNSKIKDSITTIAAGITFELPQSQVYGLIRGRRDELSVSGLFDEDETGHSAGVEVGARVNLTDRFELNANLGKPSDEAGVSYGVGAQLFITNNLGITLDLRSIEVEEDDIEAKFDTTSIGVRFTF